MADLELKVGPVVTGPVSPSGPVFVAAPGKKHGSSKVEVLGSGNLVKDTVVLGGPDTVTALKAGATPTQVGFARVRPGTGHTDVRTVRAASPRPRSTTNPTPTCGRWS